MIDAILQQERDNPDQLPHTHMAIFRRLVTEHAATRTSYAMVRTYVVAQGGPVS